MGKIPLLCDLLTTLSLPTRPKRQLPSLVAILLRKSAILILASLASAVRHLLCSFKVIDFQHNLLYVSTVCFIFKIDIDLSVAKCPQFQHQFNGDRASKMATIAFNLENCSLHFRSPCAKLSFRQFLQPFQWYWSCRKCDCFSVHHLHVPHYPHRPR